eukprot:jgi/Bigna1/137800/aug1.41_g12508
MACNSFASKSHARTLIGFLNEKQEDAMKSLDAKLNEAKLDLPSSSEEREQTLCRFLRARKFDVEKSFKMLKDDIDWRKEKDVVALKAQSEKEVLKCDPALLHHYLPVWHQGVDKQNNPVVYKKFGNFEIWNVTKETTIENLVDYHLWQMEHYVDLIHENTKKCDHLVETLTMVIDAKDWRLSLFTNESTKFLYRISKIDSDHFPERLGRLIVVNAPYVLSVAWKVIRGWLDPKTQQKIQIVRGPEEYEPVLKGLIDEAELCEEYGGKAKCTYVPTNNIPGKGESESPNTAQSD